MADVVHQAAREVVALAIDRTGGEPERVVFDVADVVGREPPHAMQVGEPAVEVVRPGDVEAVGVLEAVLRLDPAEARQRIADLGDDAGRGLLKHGAQIALEEQTAQPKRPDAPVDAVRLVQVEDGAIDVLEQVAEPLPLERRQCEEQVVISEHVAEQEHGALGRPEPRRHEGIAGREVEGVLPPVG